MTDNNKALKNAGLKVTLPRLKILEVLQDPECHHVSAEDLYKKIGCMVINTAHRSIEETATLILEHMGLDEFDNTETH